MRKNASVRETESEVAQPALAGNAAMVHQLGKGDRVEVARRRSKRSRDRFAPLGLKGSRINDEGGKAL